MIEFKCRLCKKELTDKERLFYREELLDQVEYRSRVLCLRCYMDMSEGIERMVSNEQYIRERERNGMTIYSEDEDHEI